MEIQKTAAISLLENLEALYRAGQALEALTLLQRALEGKNAQSIPWKLLQCGVRICNQLAVTREKERAKDYLTAAEQYLKQWRQSEGLKDSKAKAEKWTVVTMLNRGHWFQTQQKYHKALNSFIKAKDIAKDGKARLLAESLLALSIFYMEVRSFHEAVMYARQTLQVLQITLKQSTERGQLDIRKLSELYVRAFAQIGAAENKLGNKYGSLSAYEKGLAIAHKHLPKDDPMLGAMGRRAKRIRSSGNVRNSCRASLSTSMQSQRTCSSRSPPRQSNVSHSLLKPADRYYSDKKLKTLHQRLADGSTIPFLSTDQYFCKTISRKMNIDQDVRHLRPLSASGAKSAWDKDDEERRKVSELRLRKHASRTRGPVVHGKEYVLTQIQKLEDTALKLASGRPPVRTLRRPRKEAESKPKFPPQRLFFRPPPGSQEDQPLPEKPKKSHRSLSQTYRFDRKQSSARDDMEDLLSRVEHEISDLSSRSCRRKKSKGQPPKPVPVATCELAQSTLMKFIPRAPEKKASFVQGDSPFIEELARKIRRKTTTGRKPTSMSVSFDSQA